MQESDDENNHRLPPSQGSQISFITGKIDRSHATIRDVDQHLSVEDMESNQHKESEMPSPSGSHLFDDLTEELYFSDTELEGCQDQTKNFPTENDVIFGKGATMKHPGNEKFRMECRRLSPRFLHDPRPKVRDDVALELVGFVYSQGGRFLIKDPNARGAWRVAKVEAALKKAKQLLADEKKPKKQS